MLLFHKKEEKDSIHEIIHHEWEDILDRIYINLLKHDLIFFGIVSNTIKKHHQDKIGSYSDKTIFRVHQEIDIYHHKNIIKINKDRFNKIYEIYNNIDFKDRGGFYHVRNQNFKIDNDILIYPIHQSIDKKALILLQYPTPKDTLDSICRIVLSIINSE